MPTSIHCRETGCDRKFTYPTQRYPTKNQAACGERMHFRHGHKAAGANGGNGAVIVAETTGSNTAQPGLGLDRMRGLRLAKVDAEKLYSFIREHRKEYSTKKACFDAAIVISGLTGKIRNNSVAVDRYFKKAMKRSYVRQAQPEQPVPVIQQEVHINYCPNCGCDLKGIAEKMAERMVAQRLALLNADK